MAQGGQSALFRFAARLARASGGSLILARGGEVPFLASLPLPRLSPYLFKRLERRRQQAESYLRGMAESELLTSISVEIQVAVGLVAPAFFL